MSFATPAEPQPWSTAKPLALGIGTLILLVLTLKVWSMQTVLTGTFTARGEIALDPNAQAVLFPLGGRISAIHAVEGQKVETGALLAVLDSAQARSELARTERLLARTAGEIERMRADTLSRDAQTVASILAQNHLLALQIAAAESERDEISGQKNPDEAALARISAHDSRIRELRATEAENAILLARLNNQKDADLAELETLSASLSRKAARLRDDIRLLLVHAPVAGVLRSVDALAPESLVEAGSRLLAIAPAGNPQQAVVTLDPARSDQVRAGQTVRMILPGGATVAGRVLDIEGGSRAVVVLEAANSAAFVPGTKVEAIIDTGRQEPFSLLLGPLARLFGDGGRSATNLR